jgi:hypothetical protein
MVKKLALIALLIAASPYRASATKSCPGALPCDTERKFNEQLCTQKADWVAVGDITDIVHDIQGPPLGRDFAEFTLRVEQWEKGVPPPYPLRFKVGWCNNFRSLPADTTGKFRFYGTNQIEPISGLGSFLDYVEVK